MSWVTLALRKSQLKRRVSNITLRLTKLSQREQSLLANADYAQRTMGMQQQLNMNIYSMGQIGEMNKIQAQFRGNLGSPQGQVDMMMAMQQHQQNRMMGTMILNSVFQSYKSAMDEQIQEAARQIQEEKDQLQLQLTSAKEEEKNLTEAINQGIKDSAVKFA